jgi:hypothetical protein
MKFAEPIKNAFGKKATVSNDQDTGMKTSSGT